MKGCAGWATCQGNPGLVPSGTHQAFAALGGSLGARGTFRGLEEPSENHVESNSNSYIERYCVKCMISSPLQSLEAGK